MTPTNVYIGANKPLALYMNDDIIGFTFTVLNNDGTDYDFSGSTDVNLKIYTTRGGRLISTISQGATGVAISGNVITWNSDYSADIDIKETGTYYYELTYNDSSSRPITVAFGSINVI